MGMSGVVAIIDIEHQQIDVIAMCPGGSLYPILCRKGTVQKCDGVIDDLLIVLRRSDICSSGRYSLIFRPVVEPGRFQTGNGLLYEDGNRRIFFFVSRQRVMRGLLCWRADISFIRPGHGLPVFLLQSVGTIPIPSVMAAPPLFRKRSLISVTG